MELEVTAVSLQTGGASSISSQRLEKLASILTDFEAESWLERSAARSTHSSPSALIMASIEEVSPEDKLSSSKVATWMGDCKSTAPSVMKSDDVFTFHRLFFTSFFVLQTCLGTAEEAEVYT